MFLSENQDEPTITMAFFLLEHLRLLLWSEAGGLKRKAEQEAEEEDDGACSRTHTGISITYVRLWRCCEFGDQSALQLVDAM